MAQCKYCGRKGFFLPVDKYGICKACHIYIEVDYKNHEKILPESQKGVNDNSKDTKTRLLHLDIMKEHALVLLKYENMGLPVTNPPPSKLLSLLETERDSILQKSYEVLGEKNIEGKEPLGRKYKRLQKEWDAQKEERTALFIKMAPHTNVCKTYRKKQHLNKV
ncbi:hypothetical protein ES705_37243 [subsurface metagenome]